MNDRLLDHYKSLPRIELQRELRKITGIKELYLWVYASGFMRRFMRQVYASGLCVGLCVRRDWDLEETVF